MRARSHRLITSSRIPLPASIPFPALSPPQVATAYLSLRVMQLSNEKERLEWDRQLQRHHHEQSNHAPKDDRECASEEAREQQEQQEETESSSNSSEGRAPKGAASDCSHYTAKLGGAAA